MRAPALPLPAASPFFAPGPSDPLPRSPMASPYSSSSSSTRTRECSVSFSLCPDERAFVPRWLSPRASPSPPARPRPRPPTFCPLTRAAPSFSSSPLLAQVPRLPLRPSLARCRGLEEPASQDVHRHDPDAQDGAGRRHALQGQAHPWFLPPCHRTGEDALLLLYSRANQPLKEKEECWLACLARPVSPSGARATDPDLPRLSSFLSRPFHRRPSPSVWRRPSTSTTASSRRTVATLSLFSAAEPFRVSSLSSWVCRLPSQPASHRLGLI